MSEAISSSSNEEVLGPPKITLTLVGLSALGSIVAGFMGGLFTILFTYAFL